MAKKKITNESAVKNKPSASGSDVEKTSAKKPKAAKPEPVADKAPVKKPAVKKSSAKKPVPVSDTKPAVKETVAKKPAAKKESAKIPATVEPKPAAKKESIKKPAVIESKPAAKQESIKKPAVIETKPVAKKESIKKTVAKAETPAAAKPVFAKPVSAKPVEEKPVVAKPVAKKALAKKPVVKSAAADAGTSPKKSTPVKKGLSKKNDIQAAVEERKERTPFLNIPPQPEVPPITVSAAETIPSVYPQPVPVDGIDRGKPIPDSYGRDFIYAMARDPEFIYVYWEMDGGRLGEVQDMIRASGQSVEETVLTLRVRPVGFTTQYDLKVDSLFGNWYVKVSPDARYNIALGMRSSNGRFYTLAEVKGIETPPKAVSSFVNESWMIIRRDLERLMASMGESIEVIGGGSSASGLVQKRVERIDTPRAIAYFSASLFHQPTSGYLPSSTSSSRLSQ